MADLGPQIQALTQAIKMLDQHITAVANGQGGAAPDISQAGSQIGSLPTLAERDAQAQAELAAAQQAAAQPPGSPSPSASQSGYVPSGSSSSSQQAEQQAINAMTWNELGGLGGPLGKFQKRQYVASRYGTSLSGLGNNAQDVAAISEINNLASDDPSNMQSAMNSAQARFGSAASWAGSTISGNAGKVGAIGGGLSAAYLLGSNWASAGVDLGYGQHEGLLADLTGSGGNVASAASQGAALDAERRGLQLPSGTGIGAGLTESQSKQAVTTLAGLGFSDQNGVSGLASGDNSRLAKNIVGPLMSQGVSAQGAADWTEALRNANDTIPSLATAIGNLGVAAQAAKVTTDQYNTSLLEFTQNQVNNGGTTGQAIQTAQDFTGATGMLPSVLAQLQNNPIYQGLMMGMNGVLPSDIGNLTPGAQLEGVQQMLKLYGGGLGGLNQNKYENVGGVKVVSSYGNSAEAAQIAQMTGMSQSQITRLMNETQGKHFGTVVNALDKLGSAHAGGGMGTGLYEILNRSNQWKTLSAGDKKKADQAWNQGIAPDLSKILDPSELKAINATPDVRKRATMLQHDLLGNQKNNPNGQIQGQVNVKVDLTGAAKKYLKAYGNGSVKLNSNAAQGPTPNNVANTPLGDSQAANPFTGANAATIGWSGSGS